MCYEISILIYYQAWLSNSNPFICSDYKTVHDIPASPHEGYGIRVDCDSCNTWMSLEMIFRVVGKSERRLDVH